MQAAYMAELFVPGSPFPTKSAPSQMTCKQVETNPRKPYTDATDLFPAKHFQSRAMSHAVKPVLL